jgi:hypothetical protein
MTTARKIRVECQCGQFLLEYRKDGKGRLIKCFLSEIRNDQANLLELPIGARPVCPACERVLGEIRMVSGRPALKINQGTIKKVRL